MDKNPIKARRLEINVSLSELSRRSNVPRPTLHRIENSVSFNPSWQTACGLAKGLEISLHELMQLTISEQEK